MRDQADILAEALGRSIEVTGLSPDEARRMMLESGMDADFADASSHGMAYVRAGHNAFLADDIARVLGRPPATFASWVAENLAAFT